jgi:MSHA biogenesis protein MshK
MAEYLSHRKWPVVLLIALASVGTTANAQALRDPTRPASAVDVPAVDGEAPGGPVLQSVLIGPGRRVAVISGQAVHEGGKIGEATVARISESEVVLRTGKEVQTLKLFPSIETRRTERAESASSTGAEKKGKE